MVKRRGNLWHIRFRLHKKEIWATTPSTLKRDAEVIEKQVKYALRIGSYASLDGPSRDVCLRIFKNRGWDVPKSLETPLRKDQSTEPVIPQELTILKGMELCIKYPEVSNSLSRERLEQSFIHLVRRFGPNFSVKKIGIPEIKQYRIDRLKEGAASATVNKEKSALSKMFQTLLERGLVTTNPVRQVTNLSEKSGEREVYISYDDFQRIIETMLDRFRPVAQVAFYTGMRRGEIVGLTLRDLDLSGRIIHLAAEDTKERRRKRVPIHLDLLPILQKIINGRENGTDFLFLDNGAALTKGCGRRTWEKAARDIGFQSPPRFHDLRHTWKTNARRSGVDPEIRESILGHAWKGKSVSERYGRISDQELIQAMDRMTFDHGPSEILVNGQN